ncbi:MAG: hypothetical protein KBT02_09465 [Treponema sp.]|nr:hypothetical protein [Candidatus Treponema caballi]
MGNGNDNNLLVPEIVLTDVKKVVSCGYTTMVIKKDGSLWVSGENNGKFGNGQTESTNIFIKVHNDISDIALGEKTALILRKNGDLFITGLILTTSKNGLISYECTYENILTPEKIDSEVSKIFSFPDHSTYFGNYFYIKQDSSLFGLGMNSFGELGDFEKKPHPTPIKIDSDVTDILSTTHLFYRKTNGLIMFVDLSIGKIQMCSLPLKKTCNSFKILDDGTLVTDNSGFFGEYGLNPSISTSVPNIIMRNVNDVDMSVYHSLILSNDGKLYSCGGNCKILDTYLSTFGFIGDGTGEPSLEPKYIMDNIDFITTSDYSSFAIDNNGNLWAWGLNNNTSDLLFY